MENQMARGARKQLATLDDARATIRDAQRYRVIRDGLAERLGTLCGVELDAYIDELIKAEKAG
jgi:hypothetical protein